LLQVDGTLQEVTQTAGVGEQLMDRGGAAGPAMYKDEDRIEAADRLAEHNPRAAAEALSAIACDGAVGDEMRLSAAALLGDVDPGAAAPACLAIARDEAVGDEVRHSAAEQLVALGSSPAWTGKPSK
jgi:hypothetical protein